jgi:putative tricarboxylic transport membrane protein
VASIDRRVGLVLALLGLLVLFSARSFPNVPGQDLGSGFLPMLVGLGLLVCGVMLVWRSRGASRIDRPAPPPLEQVRPALVVAAVVLLYVLAAEAVGFLLIAPLVLLAVFRALHVRWPTALGWAVVGTLVVHLMFYKVLRVPLPWGVIRPFF